MLFTSNRMKQLGISLVLSLILAGWKLPDLALTAADRSAVDLRAPRHGKRSAAWIGPGVTSICLLMH